MNGFSLDEGSGPDDEDLSDLDFGNEDNDVTVPLRCYRCPGKQNESGCNMSLLLQRPEDYITTCSGPCINVSTGTFRRCSAMFLFLVKLSFSPLHKTSVSPQFGSSQHKSIVF